MRELADKYSAIIVNDDCRAIGVIGETGKYRWNDIQTKNSH